MKIETVQFREAVGVNPRSGFTPDDGAVELLPSGALLTWKKDGKRVLVPYSNIRSMGVAAEAAPEVKKP